jgi:hypothetical protein
MPRPHLLGALVALGVAAGLIAAAPALGAIPASGRVTAGVGPAFGPIGSSGAAAVARLHLRCGRRATGTAVRRCHDGLRRAGGGVLQLDGAGRVQAWTFSTGRWTTERGVGRGSTIAAVRRAYGSTLRVRRNRTWTYLDLTQTIAGQRRLTRFVGRTARGDIVTLSVARVRRSIIRPAQALIPAGVDPVLRFIDFAPRATLRPEVRAPWLSRPVDLGSVRTDARGAATLVVARGGALAQALAARPAGTPSPVTLGFGVAGVRRTATAQVALPAPPTLAYDLAVMSEATPGTITVRNPEPRTTYRLTAAWTCLDGSPGESADVSLDPIYSETGADTTAEADVGAIRGGLFNADCTGPVSPATHPVTFILSRDRGGSGEVPGPLDAVAQFTVPLSSAEPPDPFSP